MDATFWIRAWNEGRTGFHREDYHEKLLEYFPQLKAKKDQRVLVPLCGKSKDLIWLRAQDLHVHGIELHEQAVQDFFKENGLSPFDVKKDSNFTHYSFKDIIISCGDFLKLNGQSDYDLVYDRASLVALPASMRRKYAQTIKKILAPRAKYLLVVYEYDQSQLEGPPFSVSEQEINELFGDEFSIKRMESKSPTADGPRLLAVAGLEQVVYILEKLN